MGVKKREILIDYEPTSYQQLFRNTIRELPIFFKNYFISTFPIIQWIHRYNLTWLVQDAIAGITVGIVIVPQSMAYAKIANLDPQYGLYTSFVGVTLYCFFGTSKDISMGPISTVSLLVGSAVSSIVKANPSVTPADVAVTLGLFSGIICIIISLLRLGMLVNFVPEPAIAGYMTGSAITIIIGQWNKLFGISNVALHNPPYRILIDIISKLPTTRVDVAFGLTALVFLYAIKFLCNRISCRSKKLQNSIFLFGIMRNGLIVIVGTFISFLINRHRDKSLISIIESVPAGFDAMGVPKLHLSIIKEAGGLVPSICLILILEHISVAKSFGRMYGYTVNSDQEILAIGVSNAVGSFFGGYPSTGAFSRTAIMARSGARTPFAGVFSGAIVVLALYALTPAFYYIPDAILAAVVIHAVSDLASGKAYLTELWYTSPIELSVWVCTVLVTIFVDIESSIYAAVGLSLIIMLYKMTKPPVKTLVRLSSCDEEQETYLDKYGTKMMETVKWEVDGSHDYIYVDEADPNFQNVSTDVPAGLLVFQLCDSILYPNAEHVAEHILNGVKSKTRCGNIEDLNKTDNERTWSQEVITQMEQMRMAQLPVLKTIVLDVTAVSRIDSTGIQTLLTLQDSIDKYAGNNVPFHFAGIQNTSVRSALLGANFGLLPQSKSYTEDDNSSFTSQPVFLEHTSTMHNEPYYTQSETKGTTDIMYNITLNKSDAIMALSSNTPSAPSDISLIPKDRFPCFHWDVNTAVKTICKNWHYSNAEINIEKNDENTELGTL